MGYDVHGVAGRMKVDAADLEGWEAGASSPTFPQLKKLSLVYKRSVATLLLPDVPIAAQPPRDFRTAYAQNSHPLTVETLRVVRRAERVQELTIQLADGLGLNLQPGLPSLSAAEGVDAAAATLRGALLGQEAVPNFGRDKLRAYEFWRERAEALGVIVMQASMDRNQCRAFSLASSAAPLILINAKEFPAPRSFSLFHELAHLSLHSGALCDMSWDSPKGALSSVEVWCNGVAGAALVPAELLWRVTQLAKGVERWSDSALEEMAAPFGVSKEVMLRRLLDMGLTKQAYYEEKRTEWQQEYEGMRDFIPHVPQGKLPLNRNGLTFSTLVSQSRRSELVSLGDAADYLGTKPKHMESFESYLSSARAGRNQ
jgi:Zn-dependent peptidase ImmA (M78 family)